MRTRPFHHLLLPIFFALHGLLQFYHPFLIPDSIQIALTYLAIALILSWLGKIAYKQVYKAALACFLILGFNFFFGSIHDLLKAKAPGMLVTRYVFIIPFTLVLLTTICIYLARTRKSFTTVTSYLNLLMVILILVDLVPLIAQASKYRKQKELTATLAPCTDCPRPDIYLIVADEYPGDKTLGDLFAFDNTGFENELAARKFRVLHQTRSNYNHTYYSMASMLEMDYLKNLKQTYTNHIDMLECGSIIDHNSFTNYLQRQGYKIDNYSFFDIAGQSNTVENPFYSSKGKLITAQTFINRLQKNLNFSILPVPSPYDFNDRIDSMVRKSVTSAVGPHFVYAHFNMPHHPYLYDSNGRRTAAAYLYDNAKQDTKAFISYLKYTNKKLLDLVDYIQHKSATPPVILLLSDHGFRQISGDKYNSYWFYNLNALYLPDSDTSQFYDGMTNVNVLRVLTNHLWKTDLPLLRDSTSFIWER